MLRSLPPLPQAVPSGPPEPAAGGAEALDLDAAYRRYAGQVARWAERLAGPRVDLEDLVHDVFVVAQRRRREWRGDAKLSTWLYEITIRVVQGRRRASRRWRFLSFIERDVDVGAGFPATALPVIPAPTPIELLEQRMNTTLLYELLDKLGEKHRTAIILFELEGLSGREIAALTGTSLANVWMRILRGRKELTERLQAHEARDKTGRDRETGTARRASGIAAGRAAHTMKRDENLPREDLAGLERLLDRDARGELTGGPADLATLMSTTAPLAGLDDQQLARVRRRLGWTTARRRLHTWRLALAASVVCLGGAGAVFAAHQAGWALPLLGGARVRRPEVSSPRPHAGVASEALAGSRAGTESSDTPPIPVVGRAPLPPPPPLPAREPKAPPSRARLIALRASHPTDARTASPGMAGESRANALKADAPARAPGANEPKVVEARSPVDDLLPVAPAPPISDDPLGDALPLAPRPPHTPGALASESDLLVEALGHLRRERDGAAALEVLDRYAARHPRGVLRAEADRARVDAFFLTGARDQARRLLDTLTLEPRGRDLELLVVRGELRASHDCAAAESDFTRALDVPAPAPLIERALHGRAVCRASRGDESGAASDLAAYQRRFPHGRFVPVPAREKSTPGL